MQLTESDGLLISYNPGITSLFSIDSQLIEGLTSKDLIDYISSNYALSFEKVKDDYYLIKSTRKQFCIELQEQETKNKIPAEAIQLILNHKPVKCYAESSKLCFDYRPESGDSLEVFGLGFQKQSIDLNQ
ncbi:MAG: hypothetical protein KI790_21355, partial [Cyclobacteriaceae bacterium]|nr:hypothetical protein [Cyclobacteriaceae bacterium HetDA_MAG_MS6]